ncbi:MAG: McrB family protein [bacterium]
MTETIKSALDALFGERYPKRTERAPRVVLMPDEDQVSFAGFIHPDSPTSGVYGGMSLIWFPVGEEQEQKAGSLLTLVCGTRGLAPDEQILGRPGHARYLHAMRRYLDSTQQVSMWAKPDPTNLSQSFPRIQAGVWSRFESVIKRYGNYIYAAVEVPENLEKAQVVISSFLDFYAWERGWTPMAAAKSDFEDLINALRSHLFPCTHLDPLFALLRERRFVIVQGPPGTGKTRMAVEMLKKKFQNHGMSIQFHPAVTYETFIAGITPDVNKSNLQFEIKAGWLVQSILAAHADPSRNYLLHIDEINRADLGKVLGEAIYLFEPREIGSDEERAIQLPYPLPDGTRFIQIPQNLYILGTMNSADRSIAILDLAVRRRFAFVDLWPDLAVIERQGIPLATEAFGRLLDIFTQFAPNDALVLIPGHAYFLAGNEGELARRLRHELIPLLHEYLLEGRLGMCESELHAYLDWLEGTIANHGPEAESLS